MPKAMAALAAAILLAACSAPSPSAAPNSTGTPSGSPPAGSSSPPSGSDESPTQVPAPPPPGSCPSERMTIVIRPGDPMTIDRCVHEGTQIDLTFQAVAGYQWSAVDSSDHSRCTVTGSRLQAVKRGDVEITASLSPIARDQPSREWRLHLRIAPSPLPLG